MPFADDNALQVMQILTLPSHVPLVNIQLMLTGVRVMEVNQMCPEDADRMQILSERVKVLANMTRVASEAARSHLQKEAAPSQAQDSQKRKRQRKQ